ncbi:MAG: HD domain-containing protein [Chlamydiota bacterium]
MFLRSFIAFVTLLTTCYNVGGAKTYSTVYGDLEVSDPLVIELIESEPFQRLKGVYQYGIRRFTIDTEDYTRYDHSMGVFYLLNKHNRPYEEQIAGLLHDASHTAFSHLGDHFFNTVAQREDAYQDIAHNWLLTKCGLGAILEKHGLSVTDVNPDQEHFKALEQPLPTLCADRIDYNIQGAYVRGSITEAEMKSLVEDLHYANGHWSFSDVELAKKLARFSMQMSFDCWGAKDGYLQNEYLSQAIRQAIKNEEMTLDDLHHGTDKDVWERLQASRDPIIQGEVYKIQHVNDLIRLADTNEESLHLPIKCRGIDPLMRTPKGLIPLSKADPKFAQEFEKGKHLASQGWDIVVVQEAALAG